MQGREVTSLEFEAFLREYPRPLEAIPPLTQKARFREWLDAPPGASPCRNRPGHFCVP